MEIREDCSYTREHEWIRKEGDVAVIGITDYAQEQLGEVVYVELPTVGSSLAVGETFGVVESTKSVSDLYAPIAGEVVEINAVLVDAPEQVNSAPFSDGWMIKIRASEGFGELMSPAQYREFVGSGA